MNKKTLFITRGACVAAMYVALTMISAAFGLSSGAVQVRISEALCILPAFFGAAVPGLGVGCFAANMITGAPLWDCIIGSLATLLGAIGTYKWGKTPFRAAIFPIAANTVAVPLVLRYVYKVPGALWVLGAGVLAGEVISCGILGAALYAAVRKSKRFK